ncbi:hypothetical protein DPEC_G00143750 [Dallia pectoralis]|uniref:Uncharacterized protein n=1 Tax=Dallia pectoralis TaxID=75939 RepID=A0ACC2GN34_DALPE|nr:hypothetical protein DPEC_G00143750 [Dallia pectoralis]
MKILGIRLPEGVLTPDVIEKANVENTIQDAQAILTELEHFRMGFKVIPRLRCRKVKRCLAMKQNNDILAITKKIFFDHKDDENKGMKNLSLNKTHEGGGFRLRDKYMSGTTISTPAMKTTIKSGTKLEVGELSAIVTKGTEVNVTDLESREYRDETKLQEKKCSSEPQKFGMFSLNKVDELEMLKFFHEQEIRRSGGTRTTSYTTSNKLEYGFLSGRLDFLAKIQEKGEAADQKKCKQRIIECKCTEGDMVGKLYKTINGESVIDPTHKYSYQVQSYMYILSKQTDLQMRPAVMIVRHYHQGGKPPRDINWRYLNMEPAVQTEIDELRIYCQTEALACYLALLNLIYVKET